MDLFIHLPSTISYHSNKEYRDCIRNIFQFSKDNKTYYAGLSKEDILENIDEESKDEMEFDIYKMEEGLNILFENTIKDPLFEELYILAAATMISTNVKIGQTVLFSYDYFHLFYVCLWHFFMKKNKKIEYLPEYQQLFFLIKK